MGSAGVGEAADDGADDGGVDGVDGVLMSSMVADVRTPSKPGWGHR
jgi:hypothetical protein